MRRTVTHRGVPLVAVDLMGAEMTLDLAPAERDGPGELRLLYSAVARVFGDRPSTVVLKWTGPGSRMRIARSR